MTGRTALLAALVFVHSVNAQDTFSIVAVDTITGEVGSAGASCVDLFSAGITDIGFLGDLFPGVGAINTQAINVHSRATGDTTASQGVGAASGLGLNFGKGQGLADFTAQEQLGIDPLHERFPILYDLPEVRSVRHLHA